jgi:hypothetical protein
VKEINLNSKSGVLKITRVDRALCLNFPAINPAEVESDPLFFEILGIKPLSYLGAKMII